MRPSKLDKTSEASYSSSDFFPVKEAYAVAGWKLVVDALMDDCISNIKPIRLVSGTNVPYDAQILPSAVLCKNKVDTKETSIHWIPYARFVCQDSKKRRAVDPNDVWVV